MSLMIIWMSSGQPSYEIRHYYQSLAKYHSLKIDWSGPIAIRLMIAIMIVFSHQRPAKCDLKPQGITRNKLLKSFRQTLWNSQKYWQKLENQRHWLLLDPNWMQSEINELDKNKDPKRLLFNYECVCFVLVKISNQFIIPATRLIRRPYRIILIILVDMLSIKIIFILSLF